MPSVVSNAGPIIALASLGQLGLLRLLFAQISIPTSVRAEILDETSAAALAAATWITTHPPQDVLAVQLLRDQLDAGESEAIILAKESAADWILLDDRAARRQAQAIGLQVVGTLGILLMSKAAGHLSAVKPLLVRLRESDFHMSTELYEQVLVEAGEAA